MHIWANVEVGHTLKLRERWDTSSMSDSLARRPSSLTKLHVVAVRAQTEVSLPPLVRGTFPAGRSYL